MFRWFICAVLSFYAIVLWTGTPAHAAAGTLGPPGGADPSLATIVVQSSAIAGAKIDADKIPGNVQSLNASDLSRDGSASLTEAMASQLGSININDNLADPFQADILFRGFEASPVLGTPQGLAVYQNGVRINEAFGDTVNWDLFPDIAIERVEIVSSNPVYGLNALGGGISVNMKTGFDYQASDIELTGGSFGQHAGAFQYGAHSDKFGIYLAGKALDQNGWRQFTSDLLRQFYTAASARSDRATLDLNYTHADNRLNGQGAAPIQELAVNRSLVFTGPQSNLNRLDFLSANISLKLTNSWSLQSVLYYRQYQQRISNGNTTEYTGCTNTVHAGSLCQRDGLTPLVSPAGHALPDITQDGAILIGENDFEKITTDGRGVTLQVTHSARTADHGNEFTAGIALDDAQVNFRSGVQIGVLNPALLVLPSELLVSTPENSPFNSTPVGLGAIDKNYGAYATDTFDVTSAFSVTASGRYNKAYIDLMDRLGSNLTGNNRYTHLNPALGGTYKISPTLTAYAGVSQNTRTPTASEIECSDPLRPCLLPSNLAGDPPSLRQVVARTFEFGVRGKFAESTRGGVSLSWNLGAFRTVSYDDIYGIATSVSSGFFQNVGSTRRQGIEAGLNMRTAQWSMYANYSFVDATFRSPLTLPSASNPFRDAHGGIQVVPGDHLPGIPQHRLKAGADYTILPHWSVGATVNFASAQYYYRDESNQLPPILSYQVVGLHTSYDASDHVEVFATVSNVLNARYSTYGILGDPAGIGTPGIPVGAMANGTGIDNRFQSPATPIAGYAGMRVTF